MQLELLNEQGQATSKVDAPDTVFARDYNEALVHQIVVAFQANARQGTRAQLDRGEVKHSTKKPVPPEGHRPRPCGHDVLAAVARGWSHLPESARRELLAQGQQEDVSRRHGQHPQPTGPRWSSGCGGQHQRGRAEDQVAGRQVQGPWAWTRYW
jgi:hypothetical protein